MLLALPFARLRTSHRRRCPATLLMRSRNYLGQATRIFGRRSDLPLCRSVCVLTLRQAALCALRVVKKVPDLIDHFVNRAKNLLTDRNHGNLLAATTLIGEMVQIDPNCLAEFRNAVPMLVRQLKQLVTTGYSPEHDVSGITDPFLQVKILRLMRLLGKGDQQASETMNDILAQVGSRTSLFCSSSHTPSPGRYEHGLL